MEIQPLNILDSFAPADDITASQLLAEELADLNRKIVVLDDDPTGIQTVHGIYVYTDWSPETL